MDLLDDILGTLDLRGALYFRTDFSPPWAVSVPEHPNAARFHLVIQGVCDVELATGAEVRLGPGDLILIPRGLAHVLADTPGRPAPPLETVLADAGFTGEGALTVGEGDPHAATQMVCGHFAFRPGADHPLLRALPDHIAVTAADRAREPWLDEMLRLVARRTFGGGLGSGAAVTRLAEIVFIELIRSGMARDDGLAGMLAAFQDRQVGRALELIHARPSERWTVETLAAEVGMSRSRFADRFRELVGVAPMSYLSDWRLQKAVALLEDSRASVQQVAASTGYASPAAFTRAFAGKFGVAPREYRRMAS